MAKNDPMIGVKIDRIEIRERIGKGGMGSVYKGWHSFLQKFVAVKMMSSELSENQDFVQRFLREAQSLARVSHPNVVQVHDAGEFDEQYYIVMEFIEGAGLDQYIVENKPTYKEAISILRKCVAGLKAAYREKIIHRDIKPANIMITRDGDVKVTDFGLAKNIDSTMGITHTGQIMGTPQFISPEQCSGKDVDFRTDIYSLGAMFYRMVTGYFPFVGNTPFEVMRQHLQEPLTPPKERNNEIPDGISTVICKMMEKDPESRFLSYESLDTALMQLENDSDLGEGFLSTVMENIDLPSTGATIESVQNRKYTAAFAVIGVLLVGIIGGMGYYIFQLKNEKDHVPEPVAESPEPVQPVQKDNQPETDGPVTTPEPEKQPEHSQPVVQEDGTEETEPVIPAPDPEEIKKKEAEKALEQLLALAQEVTVHSSKMEFDEVEKKLPIFQKQLAAQKGLISKAQYSLLEVSVRDSKKALDEYKLFTKAEKAFKDTDYEESRKLFRDLLMDYPHGRFYSKGSERMDVLSVKDGRLIGIRNKIKDNNLTGAEKDIEALEKLLPGLKDLPGLRNTIQQTRVKIVLVRGLVPKIESLIRERKLEEAKKEMQNLEQTADSINYSIPNRQGLKHQITFLELSEKVKSQIEKKDSMKALETLLSLSKNVFLNSEKEEVRSYLKQLENILIPASITDPVRSRKMVLIPAGTFNMGTDDPEFKFAGPAHRVTISHPFYMDDSEVTNREFELLKPEHKTERLEGASGSDIPVTNVTHKDVLEFTIWLSEMTKQKYRLPTEAEWEWAAEGGTGAEYSSKKINIESKGPESSSAYKPNGYGLFNMCGNVWEMCNALYGPYTAGEKTDPKGAEEGSKLVIRGGGFNLRNKGKASLGSTFGRGATMVLGKKSPFIGFRCIREISPVLLDSLKEIRQNVK